MRTPQQEAAEARIIHDAAVVTAAQYRLSNIIEQIKAGDFDSCLVMLADAVAMRAEVLMP